MADTGPKDLTQNRRWRRWRWRRWWSLTIWLRNRLSTYTNSTVMWVKTIINPSPKSPFLYIGGFWSIPKWLVYIGLRHCFTLALHENSAKISPNFLTFLTKVPPLCAASWALPSADTSTGNWCATRNVSSLAGWRPERQMTQPGRGKKLEKCCFNYGKMLRHGDLTWFNHEK